MAGKKTMDIDAVTHHAQDQFISKLRQMLPSGIGLAEELADILQISTDSAYRRIRGETGLSIDELFRITKKYAISVDDVFSNRSETVTFNYIKLTDSAKNFEEYLGWIVTHVHLLSKFSDRKIYYIAEELPLFYSFHSPIFTEFKLFYWQRSVLNVPEYQQAKYKRGIIPASLVELAHAIYKEYLNIPSVEIWTDLTVLTGIRQIGFYLDSGVLDKEQALELIQEYRKTIELVQQKAADGRKNISDKEETYLLYTNEVVLGTNCIYTCMGEMRSSYITFNTLNSLTTTNPEFCLETDHWVKSLERKSTLISGVAEKQRYQFFSGMYKKIDDYTEKLRHS
jgi:hypothetical protein